MNDHYVLTLFIGLISLQLLTKIIKSSIKQERPIQGKTYGMPSTKAASLSFIVTYFFLTIQLQPSSKIILVAGLVLGVASKYYVKEHTVEQLAVGTAIGWMYAHLVTIYTDAHKI
jgi:hypothetical protein